MLAHECVLSVIAQMSNKSSKYPYCANADAPSTVASGMLISLTPYYMPKVERIVMINTVDFNIVGNMVETLNATLSQAPDFATVPFINCANKVYYYHNSGDYMQYKICLRQMPKNLYRSARGPTLEEACGILQDVVQVAMGKGYLDVGEYHSGKSARMENRKFEESTQCPCEEVQGEEGDHSPRPHGQSRRESFGLARPW